MELVIPLMHGRNEKDFSFEELLYYAVITEY